MNPCANHIYKNYFFSQEEFLKYNEYNLTLPKKGVQLENKVISNFTRTTDSAEKRFSRNPKQLEKQILSSTKTLLKQLDEHERLKFFYDIHNLSRKKTKQEKLNNNEKSERWQRRLSSISI